MDHEDHSYRSPYRGYSLEDEDDGKSEPRGVLKAWDYIGLLVLGAGMHLALALWGNYWQHARVACILDGGEPIQTWYFTIACDKHEVKK